MNFQEEQYLNLIRQVIDKGSTREDRTGTGTISIFAPNQLRFSLSRDSSHPQDEPYDLILPLLTTKRVFLRGVLLELIWFITGQTSSIPLSSQGKSLRSISSCPNYSTSLDNRQEYTSGMETPLDLSLTLEV
jgi:thymidylate synthase